MKKVIRLLPGPTLVSMETRRIYGKAWDASPDTNDSFFQTYSQCVARLSELLDARGPGSGVAIMSGEAMVGLWGAVNSVVSRGDKVACLSNGVFGAGFAGMAKAAGGEVTMLDSDWRAPLDTAALEQHLRRQPDTKLVTAVHCETPSGLLNTEAIATAGKLCNQHGALFLVDFVSSAFGTEVSVDKWHIDLGLCGTQKALGLPQDLGIVTVSERAWRAVTQRKYEGYDALLPFADCVEKRYMPYTHNWRAIAALHQKLEELGDLREVLARHERVAKQTRDRLASLGLQLYGPESLSGPTVTAVMVPQGWTWQELRDKLMLQRVELGGSYGPLKDKVMRVGHMGLQADWKLVGEAMDRLEQVLATIPKTLV